MDTNRGRIDGNRPGILGSMMGTDRVCPHHLIGVDWAQNQSTVFFGVLHPWNVHNLMGWVQEYEEKIQ